MAAGKVFGQKRRFTRMKILFPIFAAAFVFANLAQASCGIKTAEIIRALEDDCRVSSVLESESGRIPQSCSDLNTSISDAMRSLTPVVGAAAVGASASAAMLKYVAARYQDPIQNSLMRAAGKVVTASGTSEISQLVLAEAFRKHARFAAFRPKDAQMILNREIDVLYRGRVLDPNLRTQIFRGAYQAILPMQRQVALQRELGPIGELAAKISKNAGAFSKMENIASKAAMMGRIAGHAMGALTLLGIWNELTGPKNCADKQAQNTIYYPLNQRCQDSFVVAEAQRQAIISAFRATPDMFQMELDRRPALCHMYTRVVAYKSSLTATDPAVFENLDFTCKGRDVGSFTFGDGQGSYEATFDRTITAARGSTGNYGLSQLCATSVNSHGKVPVYATQRVAQTVSAVGTAASRYDVCMGGASHAPHYTRAQLDRVFGVMARACRAGSNGRNSLSVSDSNVESAQ